MVVEMTAGLERLKAEAEGRKAFKARAPMARSRAGAWTKAGATERGGMVEQARVGGCSVSRFESLLRCPTVEGSGDGAAAHRRGR